MPPPGAVTSGAFRSAGSDDTQRLDMIGVFDSGFGGLTVLASLLSRLPQYDYFYLGDNARAPYGARTLATVYAFTREAVEFLFDAGCPLVVLACNTASAQALRTLQQRHLVKHRPDRRVLGVVRPSAEALAGLPLGSAVASGSERSSMRGTVAVLGTPGTVASESYVMELNKLAPGLDVLQQACPLLVPLVEAGELEGPAVDYFLHKYLDPLFTRREPPTRLLLACTHYPLFVQPIRSVVPADVEVIVQGETVAERLADWLVRHPEMEIRLARNGQRRFATTDDPGWFAEQGERVLGSPLAVEKTTLPCWHP